VNIVDILPVLLYKNEYRIFFLLLFIYSYVHTLFGPFLFLSSASSLSNPTPLLPGRTYSALFSNFVEKKT
jgi:hypothetical protein